MPAHSEPVRPRTAPLRAGELDTEPRGLPAARPGVARQPDPTPRSGLSVADRRELRAIAAALHKIAIALVVVALVVVAAVIAAVGVNVIEMGHDLGWWALDLRSTGR